jgi:mono/diheme cytochrome c family protein
VFLASPGSPASKLLAGMALFEEKGCPSCHSIQGKGMKLAPDLYRVGAKRDAEWLAKLLKEPGSVFTSPGMVKYALAPEDLEALVAYLRSLDLTRGARPIPRALVTGGAAVYRHGCLGCHKAGGEGKPDGTALEAARRRGDARRLADYLRLSGEHPTIPSPLAEEEVGPVAVYIQGL